MVDRYYQPPALRAPTPAWTGVWRIVVGVLLIVLGPALWFATLLLVIALNFKDSYPPPVVTGSQAISLHANTSITLNAHGPQPPSLLVRTCTVLDPAGRRLPLSLTSPANPAATFGAVFRTTSDGGYRISCGYPVELSTNDYDIGAEASDHAIGSGNKRGLAFGGAVSAVGVGVLIWGIVRRSRTSARR